METTISISFVGMRRGKMEKYLKSVVIPFGWFAFYIATLVREMGGGEIDDVREMCNHKRIQH